MMSTSSPEQRAAWSKLADAATEGPWTALTTGRSSGDHWYVCDIGEAIAHVSANDGENEAQRQPDAEFIAASRMAVPALLAEVEALESRIAAALEIADGMCSMDRHFGMTIEGRGEVIRTALSGTADRFGDAATVAPYPNSGTTLKED